MKKLIISTALIIIIVLIKGYFKEKQLKEKSFKNNFELLKQANKNLLIIDSLICKIEELSKHQPELEMIEKSDTIVVGYDWGKEMIIYWEYKEI